MTGAEFGSTKKLHAGLGTENFSVLLLPHIKGSRGKGCPPSFQEEYAAKRMNKIKIIFYRNENTGVFLYTSGPKYSKGVYLMSGRS